MAGYPLAQRIASAGVQSPPRDVADATPVNDAAGEFSALYEETFDAVYRYATVLAGDPNVAEDIASEVYFRAWRSRGSYRGDGSQLSWLLSITHNTAATLLKRRARERPDTETVERRSGAVEGPERSAETSDDRTVLLTAIEHPIEDSLRTVQEIASSLSACEVVVYSSQTDMKTMRRVLQAGVRDLLPQPENQSELLQALDAIEPLERAAPHSEAEGALPINPAPKTAGHVLTVFGAKGGIGKSTIATNLGASIATDTEHSVLVMDMDTRFGDIAIMLDMEPQ